jgi:hypothetical protein
MDTLTTLRQTLEQAGADVDPHGSGLAVVTHYDTERLAAIARRAGYTVRYTPDGFIAE